VVAVVVLALVALFVVFVVGLLLGQWIGDRRPTSLAELRAATLSVLCQAARGEVEGCRLSEVEARAAAGLVEVGHLAATATKTGQTVYRLTDDGRAALAHWED
jgi:hypothetical protein